MFEVCDRKWRGIAFIPKSGYKLRAEFREHDAEHLFDINGIDTQEPADCIPWRYLPVQFPPWQTVYGVFRRWKQNQVWAALNDALRLLVRKASGKPNQPTAAVSDSQSVKSAGHGGTVGFDAGKCIKGRNCVNISSM